MPTYPTNEELIRSLFKEKTMDLCFFKKLLLFLCVFYFGTIGYAQQSIAKSSNITTFNKGLKLYHSKAYAAAQETFQKVKKNKSLGVHLKAEASYYEAMCAIKLKQPDADRKVLSFVTDYPNNHKKNAAFLNIANHYFANKKPSYALKWYLKINSKELSSENQKELRFKMGYSYLATANLTLARKSFVPLINDAKYGNDARYYYGFISYKLEDYGVAASTLKEIADNDSYKAEISYYLLDISFKTGKFQRCIAVGLKLLPSVAKKLKSDVSKIIGESYFNLKEYSKAIPYLRAYKGSSKKWNNTDFYQLGYAYYKQNNFEKALNNFNKITGEKNTVAQNAYYHLGECYLNLNQKAAALNAFKSASEMEFNKNIQEDAALNYAKLSYEEGNPFQLVSDVLQEYLKAYPQSKAYQEINELVVSSFIHQQNYEGALQFLSKTKSKDNSSFQTEVSLYRGIQLFNEHKYQNALPYFIVGQNATTSKIRGRSKYWEAETLYRLDKYQEALDKFLLLNTIERPKEVEDLSDLSYAIGYSYFKLKEYRNARDYFTAFLKINPIPNALQSDALLRLGDSYFAIGKYKAAIISYQKVVDNSGFEADYASYQIGMSHGFTTNQTAKIIALKRVIIANPVSNLKDDALYELGNTYSKLKEVKNAHFYYNQLLKEHPKSAFTSRVLLRQGLLYFNDNANKQALLKYKEVAARFPNSPEAIEAVSNAKNVYITEDKLDDYVDWVATLKFIKISNSELDNTTFAIAEKKYITGNISGNTIRSLQKYLEKFPKGVHKIKATYYLAEAFFDMNEFEKARPNYEFVLKEKQASYTEASLNKLSQIYLKQQDISKALPLLRRLEEEGYVLKNVLYAQRNLMKGYYETEAYDLAIAYAQKILQKEKTDIAIADDAETIIARASIKNKDFPTAKEYYSQLEESATGSLKSEALYYNAYFKNRDKEYEQSNTVVQELIAKYSGYTYWAVKSYVIMGQNYYGLEDVYQATFVLENVLQNFGEFEDLIKDAEAVLSKIKESEAKSNSSVIPEIKNE
jgi:tetratricopeptide (TPR) repeat protein